MFHGEVMNMFVHSVDVVDWMGETPLKNAMDWDFCEDNDDCFSVALYLIDHSGCGGDDEKIELLCKACQQGKPDLVKEMIEKYKIDPNSK